MALQITYKERKDIDVEKWDACIDSAANGLIYAKSYYLDTLAESWCAIVLRDYDAVLPLTYKLKFGIRYVCMPPFVQQLGIFFSEPLSPQIIDEMLAITHKYFKFGEYNFNFRNLPSGSTKRNNYVLFLEDNYSIIRKNYKPSLRYDLARSLQNVLHYSTGTDPGKAILLFKKLYSERRLAISSNGYKKFELLCRALIVKEELIIRQVTNSSNDYCSIALCLKDRNRIYFILSATTAEGRKLKANHFLIDRLIKEFCGRKLVLDFEGSDIKGIAQFYKSFGSQNQPYCFHRWNHLPWPISWIKDRL